MRLDMGAVEDHRGIVGMHAGKVGKDAMEYTFLRPAPETVVEGLVRAMGGWRVFPAQAIADDMNDAADDPAVVYPWHPTCIGGKVGFYTLELLFREPEKIGIPLIMTEYTLTNQCFDITVRESLSCHLAKQFYRS